jgi:Tol biopolymer transport system component
MRHRPLRTVQLTCAVSTLAAVLALAACGDSSTGTYTKPPLVDDRLVAFVSDSGNDCCGYSSIFVMHADGSHTARLTSSDHHDDTPAWSPDGSTIAFYSDRAPVGIWVVNADGSNPRSLVSAPFYSPAEPAWSPDGHSLAFSTSYTDSLFNFFNIIEIADADGSNAHQLPTVENDVASPSWSPDGTRIVFEAGPNPHLYVIKADGTAEHQITNGIDFQPEWSPDGNHIAFTTLDTSNYGVLAQIAVSREDGSQRRAITHGAVDRKPAWSSDGRQIAYEGFGRDSTTGTTLTAHRIYRVNVDGSDKRLMSSDSVAPPLPSFNSWAPTWKPTP